MTEKFTANVQAAHIEIEAESREEAKRKASGVFKDEEGNILEVHMAEVVE